MNNLTTFNYILQEDHYMYKSDRCDMIKEIFALTPNKLKNRNIINNISIDITGILYITGYSGTGKTTLLNEIKKQYPDAEVPVPPIDDNIPIIELVGGNLEEAIKILGQVGLSEAYVFLTPYKYLSDGQKARFLLASVLCKKLKIIIIDEFLNNMDRTTAQIVAYNFQKVCRRSNITAIVATSHGDLLEALAPDTMITLDFNGNYKLDIKPIEKPYLTEIEDVKIEKGKIEDYLVLSKYHYFPELEYYPEYYDYDFYVIKNNKQPIGITVHGSVYPKSWNKFKYFKEINENMRIILRSVIHPSYRSAGLSIRLLRPKLCKFKYLETRSALGMYMPRHLAAGFEKKDLPSNVKSKMREDFECFLSRYRINSLRDFHDTHYCVQFINNINNEEKEIIYSFTSELIIEMVLKDYNYYREICELEPLKDDELKQVELVFRKAFRTSSLEMLLQQTAYYPMQGFAVKHN